MTRLAQMADVWPEGVREAGLMVSLLVAAREADSYAVMEFS